MQNDTATIPLDDLYTVADFVRLKPAVLSIQTLRWQLRHREQNGLAACCVKIGKSFYISKSRYERWLATRVGGAA